MHWQGIRLFKGWISMIYDNENENENILQNTVGSCACLSVVICFVMFSMGPELRHTARRLYMYDESSPGE